MIFDGRAFAQIKEQALLREVEEIKKRGIVPKLVSILADESKESALYVSLKAKFAERIRVIFEIHHFDEGDLKEIIEDINKANADPTVHGIMVQLPVANEKEILAVISPEKDVDCLSEENLGLILMGKPRFLPATVKAVVEIIGSVVKEVRSGPALSAVEVSGSESGKWGETKWLMGMNVVIIGASIIVGKPLALILSDAGATVTICRSTTKKLADFTKQADILVAATGVAELINKEMIKEGAVVIDVGISKLLRDGKFRVVGDVDENVLAKTSFLTPVPGGVGPVTVACLFENLLSAIKS